jgi:type IV pilus assembly protein PilB
MTDTSTNSTAPPPADLLALLVEQSDLTQEQAELVQRRMRRAQISAQEAVMDLGFVSEETVYRAAAICQGLPFVRIRDQEIAEDATALVSAKVAFHYRMVPIRLEKQTLTAAFATPPAMRNREQLRVLLGVRLNPVISTPSNIRHALKQVYGIGADTVLQIRKDRNFQSRVDSVVFDGVASQDLAAEDAEAASIIHLVNQLLLEALELGATDIHIEPFQDYTKVRYRLDGMLRDVPTPPGLRELHNAIVSRLKIMASLNIAEQRLPHDGRIRVHVGSEDFDLRVSILPTRFGETLCLRILNRSSIFLELSELGLNDKHYQILRRLVELPHGMILVTGPTGSGKTTTLYASLARVRNSERKVITVEDPVEYQLEGTSQIQIRSDIGLTFASGLRSILRHDPDIILVGEIRDSETAEIAIRSALTGHLVLSTLHTNDSVGAVNRLIDMGAEPYLVSASLVASLAQRLVRRVCPHCKEEETRISPLIRNEISEAADIPPDDVKAWIGKGCPECNDTGYRGRIAIFEIFLLDEEIQDLICSRASTSELRRTARERGMRTLRENGWEKVAAGLTTIEEITRITGALTISYHVPQDDNTAS